MSENDTTAAAPAAPTPPPAAPPVPPVAPAQAADPVADKLREYGADDGVIAKVRDLGAATVDDLAELEVNDLVNAGLKLVPARKLVGSLKPAVQVVDAAAAAATPVAFDILPSVPDDGPWLQMLKTGGVLKVNQSTVISAIRAGLAQRVGLFDVPARLAVAMEQFADTNDEQVDPVFFELRKQLTRRSYAEVFEAIDGLDGTFVTEARKRQLFDRIDQYMWPAILSFYDQLRSWQENWMQQGANPAMFMAAIASMGGGGLALPPGMMQPPDTNVLRDAADAVNDGINRVFAGTGATIASAVAYDAAQIRKTLEDPRLPSLIGAANREQMLKQLKVAVPPTYPRLETNLTRFVLAIMQVSNQAAGNEELQYFGTLFMLGSQIPWPEVERGNFDLHKELGSVALTGIGGRRRRALDS